MMHASNELIIGWCAAGSYYAMSCQKHWWSAANLALAIIVAIWR